MTAVLRSRTTAVWAILVAATFVSWYLGTSGTSVAGAVNGSAAVIIVIAFVKVRFVGLDFMELRTAPPLLRRAFDGYCVVTCLALLGLYFLI